MTVTIEIPDDVAARIAGEGKDLARAVLEAVALDGYRRDLLGEASVRRLLGFAIRDEVHTFLKEHGVYSHYGLKDLEHDMAEADRWLALMDADDPHPAKRRIG